MPLNKRNEHEPRARANGRLIRISRELAGAGFLVTAMSLAARLIYAKRTARQTGPGDGHTITTDDGVRLHVEIDGRQEAQPTIIFVHGFAARLEEFDAQRAALRERGQLVFFDQRGHGSSGWGRFRAATIDQLGRDLGQVIDGQPPGPIVLVAHSMGGMSALALAQQRPGLFGDRIVGLALVSTAIGHLPATAMPRRAARLAVRYHVATMAAWVLWLTAPLLDFIAPFRREWGRRWLLHRLFGRGNPPEQAAKTMQKTWTRTPLSITTAFYPALVTYNVPGSLDVLQKIPVLIVSGKQDRAIPSARSVHLARRIGGSTRLVIVEGAGHMVNLTHADEVNKALSTLIDDVRPAPVPAPNSHERHE